MIKINKNIRAFQQRNIRRYFDQESGIWYFSISDVIEVLTDSADARNYWKVLKNRLKKSDNELVTKCNQLKLRARDGKFYLTDVADSETLIRILESVPKASKEVFRLLIEGIIAGKELEPNENQIDTPETEATLLVDAYDAGTTIYVKAMLAGVQPEHISISAVNKKLVIEGKREKPKHTFENDTDENVREYLHRELEWFTFAREVQLPYPINPEKIKTHHENGVLTIELEKQ